MSNQSRKETSFYGAAEVLWGLVTPRGVLGMGVLINLPLVFKGFLPCL